MTFLEAVSRLRERYQDVEVKRTASGRQYLKVDDLPPLPIPDYFSESPVPDHFLWYLCEQCVHLLPSDLGLDWVDTD